MNDRKRVVIGMWIMYGVVIHPHLYFFFCFLWIIDVLFFFFFFQAEDGIRDPLVTGVQRVLFRSYFARRRNGSGQRNGLCRYESRVAVIHERSEERRVGKMCRSWWSPYH